MGNVHVSHDEAMAADARDSAAAGRAAMQRDEFANGVVVADLQPGGLAFVFEILWRQADRGKRKNAIVRAQPRGALQLHVRDKLALFAHLHVGADHAVRADLARCRHLRRRINDRGLVDVADLCFGDGSHCPNVGSAASARGRSIIWQVSTASQASLSPTNAWQSILHAVRRKARTLTSMRN